MKQTRGEFCFCSSLRLHLHEQPLLPQLLIEEQDVRIGPHHVGIEVHDPEPLQAPSPGQGHVSLAALEHARQRNLNAVQSHALEREGGKGEKKKKQF